MHTSQSLRSTLASPSSVDELNLSSVMMDYRIASPGSDDNLQLSSVIYPVSPLVRHCASLRQLLWTTFTACHGSLETTAHLQTALDSDGGDLGWISIRHPPHPIARTITSRLALPDVWTQNWFIGANIETAASLHKESFIGHQLMTNSRQE